MYLDVSVGNICAQRDWMRSVRKKLSEGHFYLFALRSLVVVASLAVIKKTDVGKSRVLF